MSSEPNPAQLERAALSDLFVEVGPDAPTLCDGWSTRDLAAHLVMRERRPDGALGIVVSKAAGHADKVQAQIAAQPWDELVDQVRNGPPRWSPTSSTRTTFSAPMTSSSPRLRSTRSSPVR